MEYLHLKNKKNIPVPGQNFGKNLGCGNPDSQKSPTGLCHPQLYV
jgi:hypothetical protein